jgi:hypothetical protein
VPDLDYKASASSGKGVDFLEKLRYMWSAAEDPPLFAIAGRHTLLL